MLYRVTCCNNTMEIVVDADSAEHAGRLLTKDAGLKGMFVDNIEEIPEIPLASCEE